jgi:hypothetical protein
MMGKGDPTIAHLPAVHDPGCYRIEFVGLLAGDWEDRLGAVKILARQESAVPRSTQLTATFADQAALLGLLDQLSDMQCTVLALERLGDGATVRNDPADA